MRIALAQYNPIVGDIPGNVARMREMIAEAAVAGADLVVFGECSVIGYPPRDLLRKEHFLRETAAAVEDLASACTDVAALVGYVRPAPSKRGRPLQNVAALLADGQLKHVHVKRLLPTYDVFDETRYFEPGEGPAEPIAFGGRRLGLSICEDLWDAESLGRQLYGADPIGQLAAAGADVIVNLAASPFQMGKATLREDLFARQAERAGAAVVFVNQVGGNDELIFDGASAVFGADGKLLARAKQFAEDLLVVDLDQPADARRDPLGDRMDQLNRALQRGLCDYVRKCGFRSVVLGLSGGIDSAVVATLAADALGPENVQALAMPSRYSSDHSLSDAEVLAERLGIACETIPIEPMHKAFESALSEALDGPGADTAAENVQARIRGALVMAWSNARGHLPLATGNKSELSCGYCTLYGDMNGGLSPIGDVLKTDTYRLARHLNEVAGRERIPESTLTKPPSAELKPDQTDQDKLPPYDVLDGILMRYIERDLSAERIVADGFDADTVLRVVRMVDAAEYKRKQAAPVLKVTARAFGTGRRMPIAQRFVQKLQS